jgi:predicted TIM-barrel fold metal-dependent hydrolase
MSAIVRQPGNAGQFAVVDALAVVGPYRDRQPGTPYTFEDLLDEHERFGIHQRLVLHAEARDGVPENGNENLARQTLMREDTGMIWTALPPRRFGGQAADRFVGDAQNAGVAMLALFPDAHGHHLAPWANAELYKAMALMRLPLLLDLGNPQGAEARRRYDEVHQIATAHPGLPIILWNAFYMDERLQIPLLDHCRNVRIGLATVFIPSFGIEQYSARYGPDRLIFGSNWPHQSPGPLLTYVLYADVHDRVKHAILGDTIRQLIGDVRWKVRGFPKATPAAAPPADAAAPDGEAPSTATDAAAAVSTTAVADEPGEAPPSDAPWLEAMAELESRARRGGPGAIDRPDEDEQLDSTRAPREEGE